MFKKNIVCIYFCRIKKFQLQFLSDGPEYSASISGPVFSINFHIMAREEAVCREEEAVCREEEAVCREEEAVCREEEAVCREEEAVCREYGDNFRLTI